MAQWCVLCLPWQPCPLVGSVLPLDTQELMPRFPPGEQLLCEASTVLKYVQEDTGQRGICGRLVCTDFKISFLGDEPALDNDVCPSAQPTPDPTHSVI